PAYLENCRLNVISMLAALDCGDFQAVTILGHNLRGSGGGFGFQMITDIGAGLEQASDVADSAVSRRWIGELSSYLDHLRAGGRPH
ncbi:MAG: multi-sensor hybrid histidine kinase, partial [Phenylobacterium sp.]|nr:multi-sensor hybrid histidine kinase [Phenylobacterium sp.]